MFDGDRRDAPRQTMPVAVPATCDDESPGSCASPCDAIWHRLHRRQHRLIHIVAGDTADGEAIARLFRDGGLSTRHWPSVDALLAGSDPVEPGCVVIDRGHRGSGGGDIGRCIFDRPATLPAIVVTRDAGIAAAVAFMRAGAIDVVEYPICERALLAAVDGALDGLDRERAKAAAARAAQAMIALLSPRERDVLDRLMEGDSNKAIAQSLSISVRTVEIHRSHVMTKLKASSIASIMRTAFLAGIA